MARGADFGAGLFPLSMDTEYGCSTSVIPRNERHIQLGENRAHRTAPRQDHSVKQNSQEPEPQHPGDQQPWRPAAGPQGEPAWYPQQSPVIIQRKVVGQPTANAPGALAGNIQPVSSGPLRPNDT